VYTATKSTPNRESQSTSRTSSLVKIAPIDSNSDTSTNEVVHSGVIVHSHSRVRVVGLQESFWQNGGIRLSLTNGSGQGLNLSSLSLDPRLETSVVSVGPHTYVGDNIQGIGTVLNIYHGQKQVPQYFAATLCTILSCIWCNDSFILSWLCRRELCCKSWCLEER
jgi:hypothetical protein